MTFVLDKLEAVKYWKVLKTHWMYRMNFTIGFSLAHGSNLNFVQS